MSKIPLLPCEVANLVYCPGAIENLSIQDKKIANDCIDMYFNSDYDNINDQKAPQDALNLNRFIGLSHDNGQGVTL